VKPDHRDLSVRRQCSLLSLTRSGLYYHPRGESAESLTLMTLIDRQFLETPWYGSRQMAHPEHRIYPYLLKDLAVARPNQVWCADISYIPMRRGVLYLVPIMDWHSRKALSWRLSNSMDAGFCAEAPEEAMARYGVPEIFNTDQGSQFTSTDFTRVLLDANVKISMDGRGRWIDNRMIERLWRSLKYECVYLNAFETGSEARKGIAAWIGYYNEIRPHSSHGGRTPDEIYATGKHALRAAA